MFEIVTTYKIATIISGDCDVHVDDLNDIMAPRFIDLLDTVGLEQHVVGPTHVHGHTLDLIHISPNMHP